MCVYLHTGHPYRMEINLHILHADDDAEDRWLVKDGFLEIDPAIQLTQFEDGVDVIQFLDQLAADDVPVDAIICDMQMPLMGGLSLLDTIKNSLRWKHLPVIVYTTSSTRFDHNVCIEGGAAAFYSKPSTYAENLSILNEMIKIIMPGQLA